MPDSENDFPVFSAEDMERAHRVSDLPGVTLFEKFKSAREIDEGKRVPVFIPDEIVSWYKMRGIDYTQLMTDIMDSYRKAAH